MLYSLARFRFLKPAPPFQLGGEYLGRDERHFLKDALGSVEIEAEPGIFAGLSDGDWIILDVERANEFCVYAGGAQTAVKTQAPFPVPPRPHAARFTAFVHRVRDFFLENGVNEVWTPTIVRCPGLEPSLEPFSTEASYGRHQAKVYLPTSPEIHLKKAIVAGWTDIFEIKNCFRRGEFSAHHDNEFAMLEWYRGFAGLELIASDLGRLLRVLAEEGWVDGGIKEIRSVTFAELFQQHLGFQLSPQTGADELRGLCERLAVHTTPDDSFNDLFHRLLVDRLEPEIQKLGPALVKKFPPSQAALAKMDADGWADRFEFYWRGLEIANAFNEVNSAEEQAARWVAEQHERARLGTSAVPHDPTLIRALRKGMPPCAGIAVGLERLYMACARVQDIRELRLFCIADIFARP